MEAQSHQDAPIAESWPKVGCRNSELSLIQGRTVLDGLTAANPKLQPVIVTGSVPGDADKQTPFQQLAKLAGTTATSASLWTNKLEERLVSGELDILVHSLKDMPTNLPEGCELGAVTERFDPTDSVIIRSDLPYKTIGDLPEGSVVGTSSARRTALIKLRWPHLQTAECRGNVDTRLGKLNAPNSQFSCIMLATAGLLRLNLKHVITERLLPSVFPYAVGQGALGVETRSGDQSMLSLVGAVDHKPSRWRCIAERTMLNKLQGGCSSPVGVFSTFEKTTGESDSVGSSVPAGTLSLQGMVIRVDGGDKVVAEDSSPIFSDEDAVKLGTSVAQRLMDGGAANLLVNSRLKENTP
ncbi:hypothetical protein ABW20_dc0100668 [Dactylellina cionopaga]|nr:hypothetical protein ABW20_dc0100668 [Dactylellina cionopaga]